MLLANIWRSIIRHDSNSLPQEEITMFCHKIGFFPSSYPFYELHVQAKDSVY